MTARVMEERETRSRRDRLSRTELPGGREDRLFFAQVREDPRLEIDALAPLSRAGAPRCLFSPPARGALPPLISTSPRIIWSSSRSQR